MGARDQHTLHAGHFKFYSHPPKRVFSLQAVVCRVYSVSSRTKPCKLSTNRTIRSFSVLRTRCRSWGEIGCRHSGHVGTLGEELNWLHHSARQLVPKLWPHEIRTVFPGKLSSEASQHMQQYIVAGELFGTFQFLSFYGLCFYRHIQAHVELVDWERAHERAHTGTYRHM